MANSKNIQEFAISLPFTINDFGSVNTTTSQNKLWMDRVRSVVGTALGERVMRPTFGTEIASNVFSDVDVMQEVITQEVETVFGRDLPALTLSSVEVSAEYAAGIVYAEIYFQLPNKEATTINIGVATIGPNSTIQETRL